MPGKSNLTQIFDSFIEGLAGLVKEKVRQAVESATTEFFEARAGAKKAVAEKVEKFKARKRRRRRGRTKESTNKVVAEPKATKAKAKPKVKSEPKPPAASESENAE